MSGWKRHLQSARRLTEPSSQAVDRLRRRALEASRAGEGSTGNGWRWLLGAAVLLAAVALLAVVPHTDPALPEMTLTGTSEAQVRLTEDVHLEYDGLGTATGSLTAPQIRWESGHLHVEVTPDRGVDLVVQTEDARIEVIGTVFDVLRSALGTTVEVARGKVAVDCADGAHRTLLAGESLTCLPTSAAAWTGRARALRAEGRPDAEILEAVERGLALCDEGGPERGELLVLRLGVLIRAGRNDEALQTADAYLATGATAREAEVRRIAEQLRAGR